MKAFFTKTGAVVSAFFMLVSLVICPSGDDNNSDTLENPLKTIEAGTKTKIDN